MRAARRGAAVAARARRARGEYVSRFLTAFSNVVADEHYEQEATVAPRRRTLRSVLLLVRYPNTSAWHVFRDVLEVDGRAVRGARDGRLEALFVGPAEQALPRAQEIAAAGVRLRHSRHRHAQQSAARAGVPAA